jgi:hypothetical protein
MVGKKMFLVLIFVFLLMGVLAQDNSSNSTSNVTISGSGSNATEPSGFYFDISPKIVLVDENVVFKIVSDEEISTSVWDFGDNNSVNSDSDIASFTFDLTGNYDVKVTAKSINGSVSVRVIDVAVGGIKDIAGAMLRDSKNRLESLEDDLVSYPLWVRTELENDYGLAEVKAEVSRIDGLYNGATTDEEFNIVMTDLNTLYLQNSIPFAVNSFIEGKVSIFIGANNMETSYVEEVSGVSSDDESLLKSNIAGWMAANFDTMIEYEQVSLVFDSGPEIILTRFKIDTRPDGNVDGETNLFMNPSIEGIKFKSDYGASSVSGGTFIPLSSGSTNEVFEFLILDEVDASDLGAYISPNIESLGKFEIDFAVCNLDQKCDKSRGESSKNCRNDCKPWGLFSIWIIVLFLVALGVYIALQEWYKKHYESSLFKNPDDLYNLINFIYNARNNNLRDSQIRKKLKVAKWKGEQVNYAFKKIDGKRTGMYEIPLFKFMENKKVKSELEKRHGGMVNLKHIRR